MACPLRALEPCVIPAEAAAAMIRALPKRARFNLPILSHSHIAVDVPATTGNGIFRAVTTDLETTRVHETRKLELEFYPPVDAIINPKLYGKGSKTVSLNALLLLKVLQTLQRMANAGRDGVQVCRLTLPKEPTGPIRITAKLKEHEQEAVFYVMPWRCST